MSFWRWRVTRKRALVALVLILLVAPIPLGYVSGRDNLEGPTQALSGPAGWIEFIIVTVILFWGLRGSRPSLTFLAGYCGVFGVICLGDSFFVPNGPFQLATTGLVLIATAIVFLLIRAEVDLEEPGVPEERTFTTSS